MKRITTNLTPKEGIPGVAICTFNCTECNELGAVMHLIASKEFKVAYYHERLCLQCYDKWYAEASE